MTKPLKILDLFSGIGGFSYAAENFFQGQFKTTQFVEINPYSQKVLAKNFKGVPIHDDIKTFKATEGQFNIITGGFPCQDISVAGQQKGIGEGTRSGLFYECIRLLREVRPQFAIFENVRNLLSIEEGRVFQEVLFQIAKAGYVCEWSVVSARDVGGCHLRERVWIIAYPQHNGSPTPKRLRFNDKTNSGTQKRQNKISQSERGCESSSSKTIQRATTTQTTNSNIKGLEGLRGEHELQESCGEEKARWRTQPYTLRPDWREYDSESCLSRRNDGVSSRMDANWRNRKERIICLGNAVTPQQAAIPLGRIIDLIKS
jgi:DNA (cytosine-5)-methyltransferase 1